MKNFAVLLVLFTGLIFSSCQKENKVVDETPTITSFEEFQEWAGDRLVYSEDKSNDEFDTYIYYSEDENIEPLVIAQPKENSNKDLIEPIRCDRIIFCLTFTVVCEDAGDECSYYATSGTHYCDWQKLMGCYTN